MYTRTYNKDEIIFRQGDYSSVMYQIVKGSVGIYADYGTTDEKQLTTLKDGAYFGELGVIECYPRSATAIALDDGTEVAEIAEYELSHHLKDKPDVMLAVMKQLSARLREVTKDYEEVCRTVSEADMAEKNGEEKSDGLLARIKHFFSEYKRLRRN